MSRARAKRSCRERRGRELLVGGGPCHGVVLEEVAELAGEDADAGGVVAHGTTLPLLGRETRTGLFGRKKKDLVFEGIAGTATVRTATRDERIHKVDESDDPILANVGIGTRKYRLDLDVQLDDKRPVYQASGRFKIPLDVGELDTGQQIPVRADPDDPATLELDWDAWRASPEQTELRDGFDAEERQGVHDAMPEGTRKMMIDGWVKAFELGALSCDDFDEAIKGSVDSGMLTEAEAAAATAAIEKGKS